MLPAPARGCEENTSRACQAAHMSGTYFLVSAYPVSPPGTFTEPCPDKWDSLFLTQFSSHFFHSFLWLATRELPVFHGPLGSCQNLFHITNRITLPLTWLFQFLQMESVPAEAAVTMLLELGTLSTQKGIKDYFSLLCLEGVLCACSHKGRVQASLSSLSLIINSKHVQTNSAVMDRYHSYSPRRNTIFPGPLDGTIHQMLSFKDIIFPGHKKLTQFSRWSKTKGIL